MLGHQSAQQPRTVARHLDEDAPSVGGITPAEDEAEPLAAHDESDRALVLDLGSFAGLSNFGVPPRQPADERGMVGVGGCGEHGGRELPG